MRKLLRAPLTWMVIAELVVVAALVVLAWNVVAASNRPGVSAPVAPAPGAAADEASPSPDPTIVPKPTAPTLLPGLNLSTSFWRQRLDQLNQDQVFFEQLEWRVVHSAVDAMQRYLETVVLPSVRRAERRGSSA